MSAARPLPLPATPHRVTEEEYLTRERAAFERSEYLDGIVRAMAGESFEHADISANLMIVIGSQLKGKPCRARAKDTKVRSGPPGPRPLRSTSGLYSYPDVVVVCGEPERLDDHGDVLTNPTAIIEVLSPSTERFDRVEKFERYERWNPTLIDYLLVAQDRPHVEQYTRQPAGPWHFRRHVGLAAVVTIESIGCTLALADLYDRIAFPPDADDASG